MRPPTVFSIAGSDPGGGAGVQADLKTFLDHDVFGMAAVTAITVQDSARVYRVCPVDPALVGEQVRAVLADYPVDAIKIGMLGTVAIAEEIARALTTYRGPVVLDPVLASTGGVPLVEGLAAVRLLLPLTTLATPNYGEAVALGLIRGTGGADPHPAVLVKGGHVVSDIAFVIDVLYDGIRVIRFRHRRQPHAPHGTGCTLSSAIASRLARGDGLDIACRGAIRYVSRLIARPGIGLGAGHPPLLHGVRPR